MSFEILQVGSNLYPRTFTFAHFFNGGWDYREEYGNVSVDSLEARIPEEVEAGAVELGCAQEDRDVSGNLPELNVQDFFGQEDSDEGNDADDVNNDEPGTSNELKKKRKKRNCWIPGCEYVAAPGESLYEHKINVHGYDPASSTKKRPKKDEDQSSAKKRQKKGDEDRNN